MTRATLPDRLRVDVPAVPVDDEFVAVLAARAAGSQPSRSAPRDRPRLVVVRVAAAVAATTLGAAWAAREPATPAPAPATHERRVEPAPIPVPPAAHPHPVTPGVRETARTATTASAATESGPPDSP